MRAVLQDLRRESTVLEASDAAAALSALEAQPDVDLVLLDLNLPDIDGLEVLTTVAERYPAVPVVMLSGNKDQETIRRALDRGAQGFIPKTETREVLSSALALVLAGGVYVPPAALGGGPIAAPGPTITVPDQPTPHSLGITERQLEVLALLMEGKNNKQICRALGLAGPTVKNHVSAILKSLRVNSRTEAVLAVTRWGWTLPKIG